MVLAFSMRFLREEEMVSPVSRLIEVRPLFPGVLSRELRFWPDGGIIANGSALPEGVAFGFCGEQSPKRFMEPAPIAPVVVLFVS